MSAGASCEQLLDGRGERSGESERGVDGGGVVPGFDRGDELAADSRPGGELGLREPAFQSSVAERQDSSRLP